MASSTYPCKGWLATLACKPWLGRLGKLILLVHLLRVSAARGKKHRPYWGFETGEEIELSQQISADGQEICYS